VLFYLSPAAASSSSVAVADVRGAVVALRLRRVEWVATDYGDGDDDQQYVACSKTCQDDVRRSDRVQLLLFYTSRTHNDNVALIPL